jgi:uroporphyrin-III C-methyltransferase/precorrin-2 dehydrogenase/sirohydrochlorin ferrochelatase
MNDLFPIFLKLEGRRVLVVGGGPMAASKAASLVAAGADVAVVAPETCEAIQQLPVAIARRPFRDSDLAGAWLVVAAAPPDVNRAVTEAASARCLFVNAVDDPAHATAYAGGIVTRGSVTVAISTSGRAPALAGLLREAIDHWLPPDLGEWVADAVRQREEWKRDGVPMESRRGQLLERLNELYRQRADLQAGPDAVPGLGADLQVRPHGFVSLVGAGPGSPDLWTVKAVRRIAEADVVYYDALADGVSLAKMTSAQCFLVGKRAGEKGVCQETIHKLLVRTARRGKTVVRLKCGDPFVFGRGAEEAIALAAAGIPFEIIPGVSTAIAAPGLAGIPVTHRGVAAGVLVVSGHHPDVMTRILTGVRPNRLTLVIMMGLKRREAIAASLVEMGWAPSTSAAIVFGAGTANQHVWTGTLADLPAVEAGRIPGVIVVGEVVGLSAIVGLAGAMPEAQMEVRHGRH